MTQTFRLENVGLIKRDKISEEEALSIVKLQLNFEAKTRLSDVILDNSDGTKQWITNSVKGNVLAVLVKTDLKANPRHRGMSLLVVEKSMGYNTHKLSKLGYRGIDTGEVVLNDIRVPA